MTFALNMDLKLTALFTFMLLCFAVGIPVKPGCKDQPADIVFVLDASSSIWPPDFMRQLRFVKNVTSDFNVGPSSDQSRVAVVTFSNTKYVEFHLKDTSAGIQRINKIRHRTGGTNTADALNYLATDMFKAENGGRPSVPHIAIVITDGQSWSKNATSVAARRAREQGIQMFAIGVGRHANIDELKDIASNPDEKFVFNVTSYKDLQTIKQALTKRACEEVTTSQAPVKITTPAPTTPSTEKSTTEKLQADREKLTKACGGKPADVYFLLDSSSSIRPEEFKKQLRFVEDVVDVFDIAANKTRVGISTFSHDYRAVISLGQYSNKQELKDNIAKVEYLSGGTDTGSALQKIREIDFSSTITRREVAHILIVMTDGLSRNPDSTKHQAKLAKTNGTYIFAIGISDNVDKDELRYIASEPEGIIQDFVFSVDNFDALDAIKSVLAISTCEVAGYQQDQNACRIKSDIDSIFVYDSAKFGSEKSKIITTTISNLVISFGLENQKIRTGVISSSCIDDSRDISLGSALQPGEYNYITNTGYSGMVQQIRKLRQEGFSSLNGGRPGASKTAIVFIDSVLSREVIREMNRAKFQRVGFVFVAVGNDVDERQLNRLTNHRIIHVSDVNSLNYKTSQIRDFFCKGR